MGERIREILLYSDDPNPRFWCMTYEVIIPSRGKRRHHHNRMKAKAKRVLLQWHSGDKEWITPERVGRMVSTHCRPCSCYMCRSDEALRHNDLKRIISMEEAA